MKEIRIGFFTSQIGPIQKLIIERFKRNFKAGYTGEAKPVFAEFAAEGTKEERLRKVMAEMTIEDIDLVISVGFTATRVAAEIISKKRYSIPTICCGVADHVAEELAPILSSDENFITGLFMASVPEYLPVQMILRACPNARYFLIPYRSGTKFGRITYEVQSIREYFMLRSIKVDTIDLESVNSIDALRAKVSDVDAVVIPESGASSKDVQQIEKMCSELDTIFFGDGQQVLKKGGIYGFKRDFEFIGAKAAALALEILVEGKHPSQIPTEILKSTRRVQGIGSEVASKSGVFIADDVVASLEGEIQNVDVPTFTIGMSCYAQTAFAFSLQMITWQRLLKDKDACYIVHPYDAWRENEAFMEKHIEYLAKRLLHVLVFFDDQLAHLVWQEALRKNLKLPAMVVIALEDECMQMPWHKKARTEGFALSHIKIPKIDPLIQFQLLYEGVKKLKKLLLAINCDPAQMPDFLAQRVAILRAECEQHDITLKVVGGFSFEDMHHITASLKPDSADAVMFYQDAFCARVGAHLVRRCDDLGIPVCAGGMMWAQIAPLCYGVDMLKVREVARDYIHNFTQETVPDEHQDIILEERDSYGFSFNERLCLKHGIRFSKAMQHLIRYQRYDMMHERNIAACIEAVGIDEKGELLMKNVPKPRNLTRKGI